MNNKKKRNKRKLLVAILLVLFTGVLFSTSTYAWFTSNTTVTVDTVEVNVAAESGLQLSVDGVRWKPLITIDDIKGATYESGVQAVRNQVPTGTGINIIPVSTIGAIDPETGFMNMYAGTIETSGGNYVLSSVKSVETNSSTSGDFIAFDLYVKITEDSPIYLTNLSKVTTTSTGAREGLKNAARVAFIKAGSTTTGASTAAIQSLKAGTGSEKYLWEPNYDVHTAAGVKNAYDVYGLTTTQTGAAALTYYGVNAEFTSAAGVGLNDKTAGRFAIPTFTNTVKTPNSGVPAGTQIFSLSQGITKLRIYMWIEGQDVDCENDASGSNISFSLQFSMKNA